MQHLCKLKRVLRDGKRTKQFQCTHPHCTFLRDASYLVGKAASCGYCDKEFIITSKMLNRQGLLHCAECSAKTRGAKVKDSLEVKLEKVLFGEERDNKTTEVTETIPDKGSVDKPGPTSESADVREYLQKQVG